MVMPNIGAFIAWGLITALFIPTGWLPNERLGELVAPMRNYMLPLLIAFAGGRNVSGLRGGVMGVIATMGVVAGSDIPMFIGAMIMGPLAGWVIKRFDRAIEGRAKAGFEMLINNFSVGILGMLCAILGYYTIGPAVSWLTSILASGVEIIIRHGLLPLVSIFVEPAKVLFLNNAVNHGIFTPIGVEQVAQSGRSIMFLLETNPGPGLGLLAAYWAFARGSVRDSAPGAIIIQFFGGIHEIYFPYVLMNPAVIVAPILGSAAAVGFYSLFNVGLVAPASPGSIIAVLAMAPKGGALMVLCGVVIAAVISFLVAWPFVTRFARREAAIDAGGNADTVRSDGEATTRQHISKIVFACDAGMGSSAMGATRFARRIESLSSGVGVTHSSVDSVPADADVVVCQAFLAARAARSAPDAEVVVIKNFLTDPQLDALYRRLEMQSSVSTVAESIPETSLSNRPTGSVSTVDSQSAPQVLRRKNIRLALPAESREEAIARAGRMLVESGYVEESYVAAMQEREKLSTTALGMGLAVPHGTSDAKDKVLHSGIVVLQYPCGIDFADEKVKLVVGIAGKGDGHLELLAKIASALEDESVMERMVTTTDVDYVYNLLK